MRLSKQIIVILFAAIIMAPLAFADLYYESEITGQPNQTEPQITKNYVSEHGMRIETGENNGMIINFEKEVFYNVNFKEKQYVETKFEELLKPKNEGEKASMEKMNQMMKQMMDSMKVEKTDETQKIGKWKCRKYNVNIMGMNSEYWVTKDVKNYDDIAKYITKYKKVFDKSPMLKQFASAFEMQKKIDGFPIKTINKMMGMEIVSTVKKVENKKIDKDMFQIPGDFKEATKEK